MFKATTVRPLPGYRLFIHYTDGTEGEVVRTGRLPEWHTALRNVFPQTSRAQ